MGFKGLEAWFFGFKGLGFGVDPRCSALGYILGWLYMAGICPPPVAMRALHGLCIGPNPTA